MRQNFLIGILIAATVAWASFTAVNEVRENRRQAVLSSLLNSAREHKQNPAVIVASLKQSVPALKKNQSLLLTYNKSRADLTHGNDSGSIGMANMCAGIAEMFVDAVIEGDTSTARRALEDFSDFCMYLD